MAVRERAILNLEESIMLFNRSNEDDQVMRSSSRLVISRPKELIILLQLVLVLVSCCDGTQAQNNNAGDSGTSLRHHSTPLSGPSNPNCTLVHTTRKGETCLTLGAAHHISQAQLLQVNPDLNCKTLTKGQPVCLEGFPANCQRSIAVEKGPAMKHGWNSSCERIAATAGLSLAGLNVLNPGLSCPEAPKNHNMWPESRVICVAPGSSTVFIEYMGAQGGNLTFDSVQPLVQTYKGPIYHFALSFAIDSDRNGSLQNGNFTPFWSDKLTPDAVLAFKAANPDVRILVSLGGALVYALNGSAVPVIWQDPANVEEWIDNAQASLTRIAQTYSIDGIDIDYENFPESNRTFAYCFGTLIQRLKGNMTIGLATIAPFGDVIPEYLELMKHYGDLIDYVNFQFYAYDLTTVADYVQEFNNASLMFDPWKLLASTQINCSRCIDGRKFEYAVEKLQETRGLRGIMLWDADTSLLLNFTEEKGLLALLSSESSPPSPSPLPSPALPPSSSSPSPPLNPGYSAAQGLLSGYRSVGFLTAFVVLISLYVEL